MSASVTGLSWGSWMWRHWSRRWTDAGQSLLNTWEQVLLWLNAVWVAERDPDRREAWGRAAPAIRMLLRAMAVAGRMDQGVTPAFGTRQLARMSGYDHDRGQAPEAAAGGGAPVVERIVPGAVVITPAWP
ncbi:hypothetical protein [Nonomuraea bangladeshensis]|uniref:hypothetical protein n=1 Tax=Nonomuraea bangladeshensis TaxID=404385 RepID=UPI0031D5DED4